MGCGFVLFAQFIINESDGLIAIMMGKLVFLFIGLNCDRNKKRIVKIRVIYISDHLIKSDDIINF